MKEEETECSLGMFWNYPGEGQMDDGERGRENVRCK